MSNTTIDNSIQNTNIDPFLLDMFQNNDDLVKIALYGIGYHPSLYQAAQVCQKWRKLSQDVFRKLTLNERRDIRKCIFDCYPKYLPYGLVKHIDDLISQGYFYPILRIKQDMDYDNHYLRKIYGLTNQIR